METYLRHIFTFFSWFNKIKTIHDIVWRFYCLFAGETISVHAMVDNDASWSVSKESSFSVVFIGQHFAISGFSTVLTNKIPVTETNWVKMTNWLPQGVSGAMFSSGGGFDYAKGK